MYRSAIIEVDDLLSMFDGEENVAQGKTVTLNEARQELERRLIKQTLDDTSWNVARAARKLGIDKTNLYRKMKNTGLSKEE